MFVHGGPLSYNPSMHVRHFTFSGCCSHLTIGVAFHVSLSVSSQVIILLITLLDCHACFFAFLLMVDFNALVGSAAISESQKCPQPATMTHEYKLLKSGVFCRKLPVMSGEGERERNGEDGGRDFACEPLVLIALLQVSACYIYSRVWHTKRALADQKCEHDNIVSRQHSLQAVGLLQMHFARVIEIHIFLICVFLFFLEQFSCCCCPLLLNEYGEDTSTFTFLKYLVGVHQHPP